VFPVPTTTTTGGADCETKKNNHLYIWLEKCNRKVWEMRVEEGKLEGFNMRIVSMNNLTIGIATDIGPRILYLGSENRPQENLFGVYPGIGYGHS